MGYSEWERIGTDIARSVQDAVDRNDFSNLNQNLKDAANDAKSEINRTIGASGAYARRTSERVSNAQNQGRYRSSERQSYSGPQRTKPYQAPATSPLYISTSGKYGAGLAMAITGYTIMGIFAFGGCVSVIAEAVTQESLELIAVTCFSLGIPAVLGGILGRVGRKLLGAVKHFKNYVRQIGGREYIDVEELQNANQVSEKVIKKDLRYMLEHGWFLQGHMDDQGKCLIVTNNAYNQYRATMANIKQLEEEQKRTQAEDKAMEERLGPQTKSVIERGEEFIAQIRSCNDRIPGEEISGKISQMEKMVDQIFHVVEQKPDKAKDVDRLLDYYLPTTVKLLEAYADLDAQPMQGENIRSSKEEIEKSLDTLNDAFESIFDGMFQTEAWDVQSDISVLNTMLAQEGLGKKDFDLQ